MHVTVPVRVQEHAPMQTHKASPVVCASILQGACASVWVVVFIFLKSHAQTWGGDMVLPGPCVSVLVRVPVHVCAW